MWLLQQADAVAALPEIVLAVLTLALLMLGVFRKSDASDMVTLGALIALEMALVLMGGFRLTEPLQGSHYIVEERDPAPEEPGIVH